MKPISYEIFYNFFLENKYKIFMISGQKNINHEHVSKWLENIETYSPEEIKETYLFFANTFIEFLRYVPFDEFYNIINNISLEFNTLLITNIYDKIYFYIPDEINKSNLWVSLLFLDCLLKNNILSEEIKNKISFVSSYNDLVVDSNGEKSLCLYCDDMSYTGNQINANLRTRLPIENIDNYIVIAYISNVAKEKLEKRPNCYFFESTKNVYSYISQLKSKYSETNEDMVNNVLKMFEIQQPDQYFKMGRIACSCSEKYTAIYFDHKIADELSTFNKLLFTGSYPIDINKTNDCEINPLINGCRAEDLSSFFENPCTKHITLDSDVPCFPSFYKTITYTSHGKTINSSDNIEVLSETFVGGKKNPRKTKKQRKTRKQRNKKTRKQRNKETQKQRNTTRINMKF